MDGVRDRPAAGATDTGTVKLIVDRDCPGAAAAASDEPAADEQAAAAEPAAKPKRKRKKKPPAPAMVAVPDVIGMDHQAAQEPDAGRWPVLPA